MYHNDGSLKEIAEKQIDTDAILKEIKDKYGIGAELDCDNTIGKYSGECYCLINGNLEYFKPFKRYTLGYNADGYHITLDLPKDIEKKDIFESHGDYIHSLDLKVVTLEDDAKDDTWKKNHLSVIELNGKRHTHFIDHISNNGNIVILQEDITDGKVTYKKKVIGSINDCKIFEPSERDMLLYTMAFYQKITGVGIDNIKSLLDMQIYLADSI